MRIHDYLTAGGKNLIETYIDSRPLKERQKLYQIRQEIRLNGFLAFQELNTRQLRGKLYEIKYIDNRVMYVVKDEEHVYFLHACVKQKGKAEKHDIDLAIKRAKEASLKI